MKRVFIDTDVFVRDLRYPRDARRAPNDQFLTLVRSKKIKAVTSIFNLLEVCGVLSFNFSEQGLLDLYADFTHHYQVQLLFPADAEGHAQYDIPKIFAQIQKRQSLGDAQVSYVIRRFVRHVSHFVSWNAEHFSGKIPTPSQTPEGYLSALTSASA